MSWDWSSRTWTLARFSANNSNTSNSSNRDNENDNDNHKNNNHDNNDNNNNQGCTLNYVSDNDQHPKTENHDERVIRF